MTGRLRSSTGTRPRCGGRRRGPRTRPSCPWRAGPRRVHGREHPWSVLGVGHRSGHSAVGAHAEGRTEQGAVGRRPEDDHQLGRDESQFGHQPGPAREGLAQAGGFVDAPLPGLVAGELEVLDRVGDVQAVLVDPRVPQGPGEQSSGGPDEGHALAVLLFAGLLADQHHARVRAALPEDRSGRVPVERTALAARSGPPVRGEATAHGQIGRGVVRSRVGRVRIGPTRIRPRRIRPRRGGRRRTGRPGSRSACAAAWHPALPGRGVSFSSLPPAARRPSAQSRRPYAVTPRVPHRSGAHGRRASRPGCGRRRDRRGCPGRSRAGPRSCGRAAPRGRSPPPGARAGSVPAGAEQTCSHRAPSWRRRRSGSHVLPFRRSAAVLSGVTWEPPSREGTGAERLPGNVVTRRARSSPRTG